MFDDLLNSSHLANFYINYKKNEIQNENSFNKDEIVEKFSAELNNYELNTLQFLEIVHNMAELIFLHQGVMKWFPIKKQQITEITKVILSGDTSYLNDMTTENHLMRFIFRHDDSFMSRFYESINESNSEVKKINDWFTSYPKDPSSLSKKITLKLNSCSVISKPAIDFVHEVISINDLNLKYGVLTVLRLYVFAVYHDLASEQQKEELKAELYRLEKNNDPNASPTQYIPSLNQPKAEMGLKFINTHDSKLFLLFIPAEQTGGNTKITLDVILNKVGGILKELLEYLNEPQDSKNQIAKSKKTHR